MQDYCPLCLKNGVKKKTKLLQINLQEAILVCEEEKCTWPFGCEELVFYPRMVGKIWSCYWDDHKPMAPRLKENISLTNIAPMNTPTTSITNGLKDYDLNCVFNSEHVKDSDTNITNITKTENYIDGVHASSHTEINKFVYNNKKQTTLGNNNLANGVTNNSNLKNCNLHVLDESSENMKDKNENRNVMNKHEDEKDLPAQDSQNINSVRGVPIITSIEKTDIDISNVITGNQISVHQEPDKKVSNISKLVDRMRQKCLTSLSNSKLVGNNLLDCDDLKSLEPCENDKLNNKVMVKKSNLNVTTMEIDGLPPITLSYEIPVHTDISETVTSSIQKNNHKKILLGDTVSNKQSSTLENVNTSVRRHLSSGKQYQKFTFSAIKKKTEPHNVIDINSNSKNFSGMKLNLKTQDVENNSTNNTKNENCNMNVYNNEMNISCKNDCKPATSKILETTNCMLDKASNSEIKDNFSSQENISPDTSMLNTSVNIDTVLEDLLTSDYVPEDISDEWINSLLS